MEASIQSRPASDLPPKRPWKALSYYEESDADLFFGRAADRRALLSHILSFRSTVLYSASGTGKTSLLNAAIIPALRGEGFRCCTFRISPDPVTTLRTAVYRAWPELDGSAVDHSSRPPDWLSAEIPAVAGPGVQSRLHDLLMSRVNLEELQELFHVLKEEIPELDFDDFVGGRSARATALIDYLDRHEKLALLVRVLYRERTDLQDELAQIWAPGEGAQTPPLVVLSQLRLLATKLPPLVIICDEFEKFFLDEFVLPAARPPFIAEVVATAARTELPIKWIFSLRKEALGDLFIHVEPQSKSLVANLYRLDPLNRDQAAQAIRGPAAKSGLVMEAELVERLLDDLASNGMVSPPQLQIVCDALYDEAEAHQSNGLSLSDYQHAGGTTGILQDHLARVLERFPIEDIPAVKNLLIQLAGAQETTLALNLPTLAARLNCPIEQVEEYLERLSEASLIRQAATEGQVIYELTHAYLIKEINTWIGREALALRHIQDIIAQGTRSWKLGVRLPLPPEALDLIFPYRASLRLAADELRFLWYSAVLRGDRLQDWCAFCQEEALQLSILNADPPLPPAHVVRALRWINTPAAIEQLVQFCVEHPDPAMCRLAAEKLAELDCKVHAALIEQARALSRRKRARHTHALAIFQDHGKLNERLPISLRLGVGRELTMLRLRRNQQRIVYLLIGAALGSLPLFSLILRSDPVPRFEPIGIGLALGIAIGQALLPRHRRYGALFGVMIGGGVGGLVTGVLAAFLVPIAEDAPTWPLIVRLLIVGFFGGIGWFLSIISTVALLLLTWRRDSWRRQTIGLMVGSILAIVTLLLVMLWWTESSITPEDQMAMTLSAANLALIGLGIGLGEYLYQRNYGVSSNPPR